MPYLERHRCVVQEGVVGKKKMGFGMRPAGFKSLGTPPSFMDIPGSFLYCKTVAFASQNDDKN